MTTAAALPEIEDRITAPEGGTHGKEEAALEHALWVMGVNSQRHHRRVDANTAMTYAAVWGCVRVIAQAVATLGWHVYETTADGRGKQPVDDNVAWLLNTQPNPEMGAVDFRQVLLKDALLVGNGYAEIERDGYGRPVWLWRIDPARVCVERDGGRRLYYKVDNGRNSDPTSLDPPDVFHLKGPSEDGLVGYSVVAMARRTIGLGLDQERYGSNYFSRGPMPGGVLEIPPGSKKDERDAIRDSFERAYGGAENAGRVVALGGGMKFSPVTISNDDAQFLDSRRFQTEEVCRWFGVPPHKLADLTRSTNNNIEHQAIEFVQDCLLPWCRRLEAEADIKLFGRVNRGRRWTKLNLNAMLRGDSKTQVENLAKLVNGALLTVNEAREQLDYNPIEGGDTPLIQGAMVPLERLLEEPEPAPPASPPKAPPVAPKAPKEPPADLAEAFGDLLSGVYERLLRVEADKARRAHNRGQLRQWAGEFYGTEHRAHVAAALLPVLRAVALAGGLDLAKAEAAAAGLAEGHCTGGLRTVGGEGGAESIDGWAGEAGRLGAAGIKAAWEAMQP
jgi:HK97 family phage portal protein